MEFVDDKTGGKLVRSQWIIKSTEVFKQLNYSEYMSDRQRC